MKSPSIGGLLRIKEKHLKRFPFICSVTKKIEAEYCHLHLVKKKNSIPDSSKSSRVSHLG